ncbi:MAG: phage holin family protein [Polyangiales bacterium]
MPSSSPQPDDPSLPELLRSIADQAQDFARAEIELVKLEARQSLTKAVLMLVIIIGSGILLAIALSLVAAAIVVARDGSPALALLTAAGVDVVVASIALAFMISRTRKKIASTPTPAQLTNTPQHGSQLS